MGIAPTMAIVALLIHSEGDFNLQIPANAAMFVVMLPLGWVCRYWDPLEFARAGRNRADPVGVRALASSPTRARLGTDGY